MDKTGLSGRFDFKHKWTTDLTTANAVGERVSFITALQEQLGLRLVPDRAQVEVIAASCSRSALCGDVKEHGRYRRVQAPATKFSPAG